MRGRRRGGALASTFLVIVLLFMFGLTLAELATFDLRIVHRTVERQRAFEAAEAGLNHVIARLGADPRVGTQGEVFQEVLPDGSRFSVIFGESVQDPLSVNNLESFEGQTAAYRGRVVPAHHALLFLSLIHI